MNEIVEDVNKQYEVNNNRELDNGMLINPNIDKCSSNAEISILNLTSGDTDIVNEDLIQQVQLIGYNRDFILESLNKGDKNYATATYNLLLREMNK